jgi:hypothetical protein
MPRSAKDRSTKEYKTNVTIGNAIIKDMVRVFPLIFGSGIKEPVFFFVFALGIVA